VFSSVVPRALALLPESLRKRLVVIQQAQEDTLPFVEAFYKVQGIRHELFCFSDKLASLAQEAHLVICRAGASSLAEFAALGCPLLMIPYPHAMDDHQRANADFYTEHGAGWSLLEKDFTPASCAAFLEEHLLRLEELEEARKKIRAIAKPEAAENLAQEIISLKSGKSTV
jgi:UDP-N-acetylglucosamine--N-acetylmuramyl-(pentapeptide) pyrophosphoryl-undecaprenol N-acetylglucosamine transferase